MFVTDADLAAQPALRQNLKTWAGRLNLGAKKTDAPTFKVSGPCDLRVRPRRQGMNMGAVNHAFMGGEEFRMSSVVFERRVERSGTEVLAIFSPVDLGLATHIASLSLPLAEAIDRFDGLEAWVGSTAVEPPSQKKEKDELARLPTVEETRASEQWGAW